MVNIDLRLTVVVPVYNTGELLDACLTSLVRQSLHRVEFLCINDGSTDNSGELLDLYAKYDGRFRVVHQENRGVGVTRNRGIAEARGAYTAFLDADDYYPSGETLRVMWEEAERHSVAICGGSFSEDHGTWIRTTWPGIYEKYTFESDGPQKYRDYQFDYGYHRFIYSTEFLRTNQLEFPPYVRFQDPPFFVRAMALAGTFYALAQPTYCYRWGHQELDWNHNRTLAVVSGLRDNLALADQYEFEELRALTWHRLTAEYRDRIEARILEGDHGVTARLIECLALAPAGEDSAEQLRSMLTGRGIAVDDGSSTD